MPKQAGTHNKPRSCTLATRRRLRATPEFAHFGLFLLDIGRYPQAEAASERAHVLDPRFAEVLLLRGRILGLKGRPSEAEAALTRAVQLAPENPETHYQLGVFHDGRQQSHKAAAAFEKVVALTPDDPKAYDYLALNLEPTGDIKRADWAYKKGLSLNRGPRFDAFLDYNYGRFLMKRTRLTDAKKHLDKAVTLTPQARSARYERGKLNLKLDNLKAARDDAERALALEDPAGVILDLQVHYLLARIHRRLGDHDEARKYSELSRKSSVPLAARQGRGRGGGPLACISHHLAVEARNKAVITSLRLPAVLTVLFEYASARQAARASY